MPHRLVLAVHRLAQEARKLVRGPRRLELARELRKSGPGLHRLVREPHKLARGLLVEAGRRTKERV